MFGEEEGAAPWHMAAMRIVPHARSLGRTQEQLENSGCLPRELLVRIVDVRPSQASYGAEE